jgi:hypothetical protein
VKNLRLQQLFAQAYLLGGSPCSGKSSVAESLSAEYGLIYYKVDDREGEHFQRCQPGRQPVMYRYSKMTWNEIWSQPVAQLLADELTYYRERFSLILDDLSQFDPNAPVLLEGTAFLPELINQYPVNRQRVVFMVPTSEFQTQHYRQRPWITQILNECSNPAQAFENWMKRDELFGLEVVRQAEACGYSVIHVDGLVDLKAQVQATRSLFRLNA